MPSRFVAIAGLPRAGSTLLCQLLAMHPEIGCEGHSSPLCPTLLKLRSDISDSQFLLAQLDVQFEQTYKNLKSAMQGFLRGWMSDADKSVVIDKNRAWLTEIEFLLELAPESKILVPIRDLGQIYGSIEAQHQKTILLDSTDHLSSMDRFSRADQLFKLDAVVGAPLLGILAAGDLPDKVRERIFFVKFEDLMASPNEVMNMIFSWIGVAEFAFDPNKLTVRPHESDSHYRFKYRHRQHPSITQPQRHVIPQRIQDNIENAFSWYYNWFYPKSAPKP